MKLIKGLTKQKAMTKAGA